MSRLAAFSTFLQRSISVDDVRWKYDVEGLPRPEQLDAAGLVVSIAVVSSYRTAHIRLSLTPLLQRRATSGEPSYRFMMLNFGDFRLRAMRAKPHTEVNFATSEETSEYIARFLKTGVQLNDTTYHFFGHTSSQLKSRSCFMYAASKEQIENKLNAMGDFSKFKSVGKKAKRIGHLFSIADPALDLSPERCEDIDDVIFGSYNFTDGCGLMSPVLQKQVAQRLGIKFRNQRYLPSVLQIRYRGYKGVLTVGSQLKGDILAQFRHSMKKFEGSPDLSFCVIDYSKPYAYGYLNDDFVLLMNSLGTPTSILQRKQEEHLDLLRQVYSGHPQKTFQFLSYRDEPELAERLLLDGPRSTLDHARGLVRKEQVRFRKGRDGRKCRIMIPKSRLLFGVCDPTSRLGVHGVLAPGTCFVRITSDGNGKAETLINTEVLVARHPCLHPGDLQKFRAIEVPQLVDLVDCIVFPTRGRRPSADMLSGGDLDGDKFFVTWDPEIIPKVLSQPALYPPVEPTASFGSITGDDRAEFFAGSAGNSLGAIKNLHLQWARSRGPLSQECQQLNRIFSQCVDGSKMKIPKDLEQPPEPMENAVFVLDELHAAARQSSDLSAGDSLCDADTSIDVVELLLSRSKINVSEFQLAQSMFQWCYRNSAPFRSYLPFMDLTALSNEQKTWLLSSLPVEEALPGLVRNHLHQSQLLHHGELANFHLNNHTHHWKPIFNSNHDRLGRFLPAATRALELFHKKLIVIRPDDRLTLAIYIPHKIAKATAVPVDANVRVFAFPRCQEHNHVNYRVVPTKIKSQIYCDERTFQLYEGQRANTFVFLTRSPTNDASYRNAEGEGDMRRRKQVTLEDGVNFDARASIALAKISSGVQRHVGRLRGAGISAAEIYVISNRDIKSIQVLDAWLQLVDTEEVLPTFRPVHREYTARTMPDATGEPSTKEIEDVLNLHHSMLSGGIQYLQPAIDLLGRLIVSEDLPSARRVFVHLLALGCQQPLPIHQIELARHLLRGLPNAPYLTTLFFQSDLWCSHRPDLKSLINEIAPALLKALILLMPKFQDLVYHPFMTTIQEMDNITMQDLSIVFEMIALCVKDPAFAFNMIMEIIQPAANRLLRSQQPITQRFIQQLAGVVLDHVERSSLCKPRLEETLYLVLDGFSQGCQVVKASIRVDSPMQDLCVGEHVQLQVSRPPQDAPLQQPYTIDALVVTVDMGLARFRCIQQPPSYLNQGTWNLTRYGSFIECKAVLDALVVFYDNDTEKPILHCLIAGSPPTDSGPTEDPAPPFSMCNTLDWTENAALKAAMSKPLCLIWAPPGTRRVRTIVVVIQRVLLAWPDRRILVTAPTNGAVDALHREFVNTNTNKSFNLSPLRIVNALSEAAIDLWESTYDTTIERNNAADPNPSATRTERILQSRLVLAACTGTTLGLLGQERFDTVIIDDASQQCEPASLMALTRGYSRAVLFGDHGKQRSATQKHATAVGFDVSLFERLYNTAPGPGIARVMLRTQHQMHPNLCKLISTEFYNGKLESAKSCNDLSLPASSFPWPRTNRKVFIQCFSAEDLGGYSKSNAGQLQVCVKACKLLIPALSGDEANRSGSHRADVAVLTPYTEQEKQLRNALPTVQVSSVEGFQNRQADVVLLVTVRCNVHAEMGVLRDMRLVNVALTRARAGVIIIGDRETLTGRTSEGEDQQSKDMWIRLLNSCAQVSLSNAT